MTQTALVRLRSVCKEYRRGSETVNVLQSLDLDIAAGDFLALMGPSGSGKSTLLNLIGGLDRPSGGTIEIDGKRVDNLSDSALTQWRARHVGFVFQMYNLLQALNERQGKTIIMVTHDPVAAARAKRVLHLEKGVLVREVAESVTQLPPRKSKSA